MNEQKGMLESWASGREAALAAAGAGCSWIFNVVKKGPSDKELEVLPEVIKATVELFKLVK
jgi:hypothetical protein